MGQKLGCCGPGKWRKKGKSPPKVVRGAKGLFDSFGPREQRSPKSLVQHQNWPNPLWADNCQTIYISTGMAGGKSAKIQRKQKS